MMYREEADCEVDCILQQKGAYEQWYLPETSVDLTAKSRNFDPSCPDQPRLPPDDPVAHRYMHCPSDQPGYRHWHADGDAVSVESPGWRQFLNTNGQGELELSPQQAFDLAIVHNRDYQFELENVYLTALQLTLERFEFDLQWFGGNTTEYRYGGINSLLGQRDEIASDSFLGFTKNFAAGGQLLVNFANSLVWELSGSKRSLATSNLTIDFVQPLLRGAFRDIRLENLTQSERNVLYAVRDYARFRKQFYVDVVSGEQGYLDLLLNLQAIRNLEQNVQSLEQNLRAHEALAEASLVSQLQVDLVFQRFLEGRLALIRARNRLENSLDAYKILLGVPPEFPVDLDDSKLNRFELTDAEANELEQEINDLYDSLRGTRDELDSERLDQSYQQLQEQVVKLNSEIESLDVELQQWERNASETSADDSQTEVREKRDRASMRRRVNQLRRDALRLQADTERRQTNGEVSPTTRLKRLARSAADQIAELLAIQTQVRTYLIELETIEVSEVDAIELALKRRLDLSNQQARVVDSWRKIRVAKDALEADLDVFLRADIATQPDSDNPLDFSSEASSYRVGVALDGPLNRLAERNNYRAELIEYQRQRRDWIGQRDSVVQAVRRDLRTLDAEKLNFEISRQSLIAAARQVEQARLQLLSPDLPGNDSSKTRDALNALSSLLAAKNSLIASWVDYETARYQLLLDIESLDLEQYGQIGDDARVGDTLRKVSPGRAAVHSCTSQRPRYRVTGQRQ